MIIYYWKPISKFFGKLFSPVIAVFKNVFGWVGTLWEKAKNIFKGVKEWISDSWVGKAWNWAFGDDEDEENEKPKPANDNKPPEIGRVAKDMEADFNEVEAPNITTLPTAQGSYVRGNTNITVEAPITINASEGMSEKKIAEQVKIALKEAMREANSRKRAANYD